MSAATSHFNLPDLRASERALLHLLRLKGALSKAELARLSNMSAQGVSIIVERLLDLGLVRKGSKKRGRVGQPSTPIELNPEGAISLGIFIGSKTAQLIIVDFAGDIILERQVDYDDPRSDATSQKLVDVADAMVGGIDERLLNRRVGICVSAHASLLRSLSYAYRNRHDDQATGAETEKRLASRLSKHFALPVYCVNDIKAACLAQIVSDAEKGAMTTLYLDIGETFGSGLILEGRLIGSEDQLSSGLHALPVFGLQGARVEDFASFKLLRNGVKDAGFGFNDQISNGFTDTRTIFEDWRKEAISALALAVRAAGATVSVERVLVASRLNSNDTIEFVNELRFAVETNTCADIRTPEISDCAIGPNARAWGTAIVPFFKAFGPSELNVTGLARQSRSAVA